MLEHGYVVRGEIGDRAGEMIPEVGGGGLGLRGPRGKGSPSVSKGPKQPIQLLQLLTNSPREVKRAHLRYVLGPPWSHPGTGIYRARRGRSLPVPPVSPAMDSRGGGFGGQEGQPRRQKLGKS